MLVIFLFALLQYSLAATPICTNGFRLINNRCLKHFGTSTNHQTAERTCMNYGATLVTIRNAIDNRGVQTVSGTSSKPIWMGLYCFENDVTRCLWDDASGDSSAYSNFMAETCEQQCGNLVSIHSANENRFLNSLFIQSDSGSLLIGATHPSKNSFSWVDGSLWSYNNIDTTAASSGNCIAMSFGTIGSVSPGYWYTVNCSISYGFMCKRPAGVECPVNPPQVTVTPVPNNPSYCNSALIMAPGTITSPNYPSNYNNMQSCSYQLATLGAYNVLLRFTDFITESGFDKVTVFDGDSINSPIMGIYSGNLGAFSVVSTGNSMMVTFRTDQAVVAKGFSATFSAYSYHT
uniref:C-type LECtin n=1 Tax=Caenorhabditis tropicalis TaxID=1561998 RepID=A0A1I7U568_9PELO